jgi:hypothetical protein
MKQTVRRKLTTYKTKIVVDKNGCVEFDDFTDTFKKRIVIHNNELRLSRDTFTAAQERSIKMLEKLEAYYLIYI